MNYEQVLQVAIAVLPLIVVFVVALAKRAGLSPSHAPMLVTSIAVIVALCLWWFYPHVEFNAILAALMAALASGTLYSLGKETARNNPLIK